MPGHWDVEAADRPSKTWRSGDEVLVTRLNHDANVAPWVVAAAEAGATIRYLEVNPSYCTAQISLPIWANS